MGLFSFGSKDNANAPRAGASGRTSRGERRTERRAEPDAMLLDPTLPEKQRARRRLVGAIALVVAAVVVLPMILDSHPKPVTDDIAIDIPNRPDAAPAQSQAGDNDATDAAAPDNPPAAQAGDATAHAGTGDKPTTAANKQAGAESTNKSSSAQSGAVAGANTAQKATGASVSPKAATGKQATAANAPNDIAHSRAANTVDASTDASTSSGTPNAPAGSRYVVQLGSLESETTARDWVTRLKALGVPAYLERRRQADGTDQVLLRAGPFADRAAASAAVAKVRQAGLTAGADGKRTQ
jgi:DedD protein